MNFRTGFGILVAVLYTDHFCAFLQRVVQHPHSKRIIALAKSCFRNPDQAVDNLNDISIAFQNFINLNKWNHPISPPPTGGQRNLLHGDFRFCTGDRPKNR